ncbi:hypothetical protein C0989_005556 [Termitomyces sp. Mn162]|nr:hypothetical protein C0989_005556 [Termitomyces sp. Mn162]
MSLPSMPLYQPLYAPYPRESLWMSMPNNNPLLLCCVDTAERLATLPVTVLKGCKCIHYLSTLEQEELLIQLLAAWDATGAPSPNMPIAVSTEVANVSEVVPVELESIDDLYTLLPSANHFTLLSVKLNISVAALNTTPEIISPFSDIQTSSPAKVSTGNTPPNPCLQIPAWECHLSYYYIVASTPSANSLRL